MSKILEVVREEEEEVGQIYHALINAEALSLYMLKLLSRLQAGVNTNYC